MKRGGILLILAVGAVIVFDAYTILSAIHTSRTTGVLEITSSNPRAAITVSQNNTQAVAIGLGKAKARLRPGSYRVSGAINRYQSVATVRVYKDQISKITLKLTSASNPSSSSSLYGISITNTSELNNLLLPDQLSYVLQATGNYIINHINATTQSAVITNTTLNQDGSIDYTVETNTKPAAQIKVLLQPQAAGVIDFSVPSANYSTNLNPY